MQVSTPNSVRAAYSFMTLVIFGLLLNTIYYVYYLPNQIDPMSGIAHVVTAGLMFIFFLCGTVNIYVMNIKFDKGTFSCLSLTSHFSIDAKNILKLSNDGSNIEVIYRSNTGQATRKFRTVFFVRSDVCEMLKAISSFSAIIE